MLHAKFQNHRTLGSGEEVFFEVLAIYWYGGHSGHVAKTIFTKYIVSSQGGST